MSDTEHLRCTVCESNVTAARIDGDIRLVCHCTHVDGRIAPQDPDKLHRPVMPYGWEFVQEGVGDD